MDARRSAAIGDPPPARADSPVRDRVDARSVVAHPPKRFEDFYRDHAAPVLRALALTLDDQDLATDAVNEAMTRAYQRWHQVATYDNPAGWVYRVGLNWSRTWRQRRRRERQQPHGTAGGGATLPHHRDDSMDRALGELSMEFRAVVVCRLHLDWSVDQTAAALDIKPGTVKSRLARALHQLRQSLDTEATETDPRHREGPA